MVFYDIGCAPSNFLNLLGTWVTITGRHVELPVENVGNVESVILGWNQIHHLSKCDRP